MYFSDRETPYPYLEIVDKKQNSHAKILTLKVHPPVIGAFPLVRKRLDTPLHLPEWSTTETKDIMDNFSGKVMTAEVPLFKSSTHQYDVIASSARRDENFSSWLCKFVLPNKKVDCVRASVFKIASLMAHGEKFSLAVPVLASFYRGLRDISTSSNLVSAAYSLPFIMSMDGQASILNLFRVTRPQRGVQMWHISGEKMAKHFEPVDARKLFQQVNVKNLHHLAMLQGKERHIEDTGKMSNPWSDFLIGLRSSFVTLRHDDDLIVEPYSLHGFSRQFGFCQDVVPGVLVEQHYDSSLLALVQLSDSCVLLRSSSASIK
ncbi:hypothetical protein RND71_008582 [Anisodus tanguticus]|uniref:Aminotransferase-like plant mobile domain-containing protein n=1 Tax=Anisodus tanguticus TaxID=243964 RepID=A0AAE1SL32_9SOLA|nr:hypothetical protein RND71_008582 [Anisodus tanguticus]